MKNWTVRILGACALVLVACGGNDGGLPTFAPITAMPAPTRALETPPVLALPSTRTVEPVTVPPTEPPHWDSEQFAQVRQYAQDCAAPGANIVALEPPPLLRKYHAANVAFWERWGTLDFEKDPDAYSRALRSPEAEAILRHVRLLPEAVMAELEDAGCIESQADYREQAAQVHQFAQDCAALRARGGDVDALIADYAALEPPPLLRDYHAAVVVLWEAWIWGDDSLAAASSPEGQAVSYHSSLLPLSVLDALRATGCIQ